MFQGSFPEILSPLQISVSMETLPPYSVSSPYIESDKAHIEQFLLALFSFFYSSFTHESTNEPYQNF